MNSSSKAPKAVLRASSCLVKITLLMVLSAATWPATANHVAGPATQGEEKGKAVVLGKDADPNGYNIIEQNKVFLFRAINVRDPVTRKPLEGKHKVELVCGQIPYVTGLFFNKGNSERMRSKCLVLSVTPRIIIQEEE